VKRSTANDWMARGRPHTPVLATPMTWCETMSRAAGSANCSSRARYSFVRRMSVRMLCALDVFSLGGSKGDLVWARQDSYLGIGIHRAQGVHDKAVVVADRDSVDGDAKAVELAEPNLVGDGEHDLLVG